MKTCSRLSVHDRLLTAALAAALAAAGLFWVSNAHADDIDIYSLANTDGFRPNVLIILDNSANWSASITIPKCTETGAGVQDKTTAEKGKDDDNTEEGKKMGAEKCALYRVISSLSVPDLSQFNFALMLFNESPDEGGYPRKAFVQVKSQDDKDALLKVISEFGINRDKTNNAQTAASFYEAYQWFTGGNVYLGNRTATKHDSAAFTDSSKTSTSPGLGCARNHIITSLMANRRTATPAPRCC
jgi:type IV pilus assembly protein PilY1